MRARSGNEVSSSLNDFFRIFIFPVCHIPIYMIRKRDFRCVECELWMRRMRNFLDYCTRPDFDGLEKSTGSEEPYKQTFAFSLKVILQCTLKSLWSHHNSTFSLILCLFFFTSRHILLQMQFGVKYSTRHNGLLVCYKMSRQFDRCLTRGFLGRHKKYHIMHIISSYCRYCKLWTSKRSRVFFILLIILFQSLFSLKNGGDFYKVHDVTEECVSSIE